MHILTNYLFLKNTYCEYILEKILLTSEVGPILALIAPSPLLNVSNNPAQLELDFQFLLVDIGILIYANFNPVQILIPISTCINGDIEICTRRIQNCAIYILV